MKPSENKTLKDYDNDEYRFEPTQRGEKVLKWLAVIATITAMVVFLNWIDNRDQELMEWAIAYEKCVAAEYPMTPTAWYQIHGEYPECDADPYYESYSLDE